MKTLRNIIIMSVIVFVSGYVLVASAKNDDTLMAKYDGCSSTLKIVYRNAIPFDEYMQSCMNK